VSESLRDNGKITLLEAKLKDRESVIQELKKCVAASTDNVKMLQVELSQATHNVKGADQTQMLMELHQSKQQVEILRNTMEEKNEECRRLSNKIIDAELKCKNLQTHLENSIAQRSAMQSSADESLKLLQERLDESLKQLYDKDEERLQQQKRHEDAIMAIKQQHQREMEQNTTTSPGRKSNSSNSSFDIGDMEAFQEQVSLLRDQLEKAFLENDSLKQKHNEEVSHLISISTPPNIIRTLF
jgi:predicted secreted protein